MSAAQAQEYAALGYGVFLCQPQGKAPATKNGLKDATTDLTRISRWPDGYNLGLLPPEEVVVVDADTREEAERVQSEYPELGRASRQNTPHGAHFIVRLPEGVKPPKTSTRVQGRPLDVRGLARAYILTEPSTTPEGGYKWVRPLVSPEKLTVASPELLALLTPTEKPSATPREPFTTQRSEGTRERRYAEAALRREHDAVASAADGTRNHALNGAAYSLGQLVGAGVLERDEVEDALNAAAETCGLDPRETEATLKSGLEAGMKEPRELPTGGGLAAPGGTQAPASEADASAPADYGAREKEQYTAQESALDVNHKSKGKAAGTKIGEAKQTEARALITRMSDIEPQDVTWLWHPYIPIGKLTLLEGDPGLGKTFISLTLAAAITRGWPLLSQTGAPSEELMPADVLYMSAEDGLADTLRPRLDAADADVSRVHALTGWQQTDERGKCIEGAVSLGDIPILEQALQQTKAKLIIIDPLQAYLGAKVDMHRANEVRPLLSALGNLAEKHGCAVVCIRHLSKALSPKAIYSGMGSIDFAAAARSILTVGEHEGERLLAHVKSSLAPQGKSIRYELKDGSLNWLGVSDVTAEELRVPQPQVVEGESTVDAAITFLQDFLDDGPQPANATFKAAKQEGISERILKRAKAQLEVKSQRASAGNAGEGQWLWSLPYSTGTLAPLRAHPIVDAHSASVPSMPMEPLEPLQKEREGHEKPQGGKGAALLPLESDDLSGLVGTLEGEL